MKTDYCCSNCDHFLLFFPGMFICLKCGALYSENLFSETYLIWTWCQYCERKLTTVRSYDKLHFMYCTHCGSLYYHKEIFIH